MVQMVITKTNTHAGPPLGSRWAQKWAYMWAEQLVRFWYMLPKVTIITTQRSVPKEKSLKLCYPQERLESLCPGDSNNKCAEPSLLKCHRCIAFSRPSSPQNYRIVSKLCLPVEQHEVLHPGRIRQTLSPRRHEQ